MKKIIALVTSLMMLTGCSINYNINFHGDEVNEEIKGIVTKKELGDGSKGTGENIFYDILYNDQFALINGKDLYTKNVTNKKKNIEYSFYYTYNNNYKDSRVINTCFSNSFFDEDDKFYYISLEGPFTCLYSDKIIINLTSDYVVISDNANRIKNNTYTWIIENEDTANINIVISKDIKSNTSDKKNGSKLRIICFVILLILSVVTYLLHKKVNSDSV